MLETALVVVLGIIAWIALNGSWGAMPVVRGRQPRLSRNEPIRFSLRTLLIATTLVAVVLGLIVWLR
jgi:hypothetical protein